MDKLKRLIELKEAHRSMNLNEDDYIGIAQVIDEAIQDEKRPHGDHLIRHKWPEEKPEKDGQYLIRIISPIGSVYYRLRGYEDGEWHNFGNYLTHWWNLPEVGNETI